MNTTPPRVPASTVAAPAITLSQLQPEHDLQQALAALEAEVRKRPTHIEQRWALVELLCVLGHWERALQQLQAAAQLVSTGDPHGAHWQAKAQLVRGLVRAHAQRKAVFAGEQQPVPVVDNPPWMQALASALGHNARGEHAQADALRSSALQAAPTQPGICTGAHHDTPTTQPYSWISDTDTRLGPVCELVIAGGYRWLAFADLARLSIQPPSSLLDLVWLPVTLQLRGTQAAGKTLHAYIPTRYVATEEVAHQQPKAQGHALLLARRTQWHEVGDTGIFALGQKTFMTDQGDFALLDIRQLHSQEDL
ncbi:MAG: type VI secretion system accessory protein TagJ [Rhodoferax sp.]|nr:type VI secretion system accessory protein TagJ [Rhodoferax sp.]